MSKPEHAVRMTIAVMNKRISQTWRRTIFVTAIGLILGLGIILQVKASSRTAAPDLKTQAWNAILQSFDCTLSLLTFRLRDAELSCSKTIALLPDSPLGYKFRGFAYLLEHRFERAEMDLREAVRLDPSDPENQAGLAQAMSGQGHFDEAIARFGVALAISPHDARYLAARCWARAGQGADLNAALADCNLAIRLVPEWAVAYDDRGLVHLRQGKNELALQDYVKSLSLQGGRSTALFGQGIAEWHLGRIVAARADLARARAADPDIDETYILAGVLPAACRKKEEGCPLPEDLRAPDVPAPLFFVSDRNYRDRGLILQP